MSVDKKISYVEQDGSLNFIKNSKSVTVPKRFKARKNAPATKLAYITDAEAKMLKKAKKGTPHKGPKGIPSYDSFGSIDASGKDTGRAGSQVSAAESGDFTGFSGTGGGPELPPGVKRKPSKEAQDLRSAFIAAGGGQRVNPGFFDSRNRVSPFELARAREFNPAAFTQSRGGILGLLTGGGLLGNVIRGVGQRLGFGKRFNQPTYDMSGLSGLPLGGSAIFENLDIRDKFNRKGNLIVDATGNVVLEEDDEDEDENENVRGGIETIDVGFDDPAFVDNLIADATYNKQKEILENLLNTEDTGLGESIEKKEQRQNRQQELLNEILTG